jgi:hypothetical protein
MIALVSCHALMIAVINVNIASQLQWRWLFGRASVAALLILSQELDRQTSPAATLLSAD